MISQVEKLFIRELSEEPPLPLYNKVHLLPDGAGGEVAALSGYFAGNDNPCGVLQWGGWVALAWSGKDIRIILEDDSGVIQGDTLTQPA